MMNDLGFLGTLAFLSYPYDPKTLLLIVFAGLWSLAWKGVAMWKAVERKEKIWFIIFLVVNLLAIPEIFYLFFVANKPKEKAPTPHPEA